METIAASAAFTNAFSAALRPLFTSTSLTA